MKNSKCKPVINNSASATTRHTAGDTCGDCRATQSQQMRRARATSCLRATGEPPVLHGKCASPRFKQMIATQTRGAAPAPNLKEECT